MNNRQRWFIVVIFSVAMAWLESAVVFYLRTWCDRIDPYQAEPLPNIAGLGGVEVIREAATLIMLWLVGMLAGTTPRSRWGYSAVAFGVWDIFYYIFLRLICPWPKSLLDWDILFLLPLPWWGPVLAPVLIAVLMILWGTLASQGEPFPYPFRAEWRAWLLNFAGMAVALYVFMADALQAVKGGPAAVRQVLPPPHGFNWLLFTVALALMAAPVVHTARKLRSRPSAPAYRSAATA